MSKDWYLIKPPYSQVSGFENDDLESGFNEALDTGISSTIEIYNYDLTLHDMIKGVVLNTVQDTQLKSMVRNILLPIGSCKAGQYIKLSNRYWLITGIVDNNTVYEKAIAIVCNYYLTWMNDNGDIIQRWTNIESASQYNNGETTARNYELRTDQLIVSIPDDNEVLKLGTGKRFIVDRRCKLYEESFDDTVERNTSNPLIIYKITRTDNVLYDYQNSGYCEFLISQDEKQDNDGYYFINGKGYWLCGEPPIIINTSSAHGVIQSESDSIYSGFGKSLFKAVFYDENEEEIETEVNWEINSDFNDKLSYTTDNNIISISTSDQKLIGKSFELIATTQDNLSVSKTIYIHAFI